MRFMKSFANGVLTMQIKKMPLADLKPYEHNPRLNDSAVDAVVESIKAYGFKVPLVIDSASVIVAGHTRFKAAQRLGLDCVPCIVADDLTPEQIKAFRLVDNKTAELASFDAALLAEELQSLTGNLAAEFTFELPMQDEPPFVKIKAATQKSPSVFESMTFTFTAEQKKLVEASLAAVEVQKTFGNKDQKGNALYEIVRQWTAKRSD